MSAFVALPVILLRALHAFQSIQVVSLHLANTHPTHQARTGRSGTGVVDEASEERRYGLEKEEVRQGVTGYHGSREQYIIKIKVVLLRIRPESLFSRRNGVQETRITLMSLRTSYAYSMYSPSLEPTSV
ncbi:hypothetical protein ARMGADRAFT_1092960 [Armillaria gallica]|uniref:Secreted protein n=1 Tax=Armillaria gallica TaxID=47427 RepID=A0A2H3CKB4_ARMGA|nr:hypothetical protein ARMGADRAFT_1092960 [Armillaria gallica]